MSEIIYLYFIPCILLAFLATCSFFDFRSFSIPLWGPLAAFLLLLPLQLISAKLSIFLILLGLIPGIIFLLFSLLKGAGIGHGDGLSLIACGAGLGIYRVLAALFFGLLFTAIYGTVLLVRKKAGPKSALPFLPFLLGGYVCLLLLKI